MSNRAIAPVAGVSEGTVRNDLGAQNCAPDETTSVNGLDGKAYPVRPKAKAKARTEPQKGEEVSEESDRQSSARRSRTNVVATVTRVVMQAQDAAYAAEDLKPEHFKQRKEEATRWARDLDKAIQSLQQLADLLKEQSE